MEKLYFEWDEKKNKSNLKKHGISFEEARTVFSDKMALVKSDPDHSIDEERFVIMGFSNKCNLLVVVHCVKESANTIRIISARRATATETQWY